MRPGLSSPNYKDGKYVLGLWNKRDFAILTICIIFTVAFIFITEADLDTVFRLFVIDLIIFGILMPFGNYQSVYTIIYYVFRYLTIKRRYLWKGVCYAFKEKEE